METRLRVDQLTGRELDAEIARRLFGLRVEPRKNTRTHQQDFVYEVNPGQWVQVAYYSRSGSAWLHVVSEMSRRGWMMPPRLASLPTSILVLQHEDGRRVEAAGPANVALCRAALKAVPYP